MFEVRQHGVKRLPEIGGSPYHFYVDVCDRFGHGAFRDGHEGVIRDEVLDWCNKNCSRPAMIGGYEMVCFETEDDALLFYLSFKK